MSEAESQVQAFIDKFDDDNARLIISLRACLKDRLPGCWELVWDNYNFLVLGYSPTNRPSDYLVSLAAGAKGVALSFNNGAQLADPDRVLLGAGKVNRFIRLPDVEELQRPEVDAMIERACQSSNVTRPWADDGELVIRGISAKQRPRTDR